jgi:hypothetical protein
MSFKPSNRRQRLKRRRAKNRVTATEAAAHGSDRHHLGTGRTNKSGLVPGPR